MANRKSPSNAQSAPKGKRLAAFAAAVDAVANAQTAETDTALANALNKRSLVKCAQCWETFVQRVASVAERQAPGNRMLPSSEDLAPLP